MQRCGSSVQKELRKFEARRFAMQFLRHAFQAMNEREEGQGVYVGGGALLIIVVVILLIMLL
jgi:hypothetical protein